MSQHKVKYHNEDRVKVLYGQIMMAAAPMFERIDEHDQLLLIQRVANDLMRKLQLAEACRIDAHILDIPEEESIVEEVVEPSIDVPDAE